jgi:hypothetical protein
MTPSDDLAVEVLWGRPDPHAAAPTFLLGLRLTRSEDQPVHAMVLKAQIRLEPQRRRYSPAEEARLVELFGEAPRWGETLKPFLWTHVGTAVAGFTGSTEIELAVPCTYDFEVAAAKYLHGLDDDGEIPLVLFFSGTIFGRRDGALVVQPVGWDVEASHRLPVRVWRDTMDAFFPGSGWIRLRRDTIDALTRYKADRALTSWEDAFERLLKEADG